jgi:hypothetical protein
MGKYHCMAALAGALLASSFCVAGEPGEFDLDAGLGPALFETGFPNLAPAYGASIGYRINDRLGIAAYVHSIDAIATHLDPNFRGAQLHFGLESRFYPAFEDRLSFALRIGAGRYRIEPTVYQFDGGDAVAVFIGPSSVIYWDLGLKAAYDLPLNSWLSISTQAIVQVPSQAGGIGTVTALAAARVHANPEPTRPRTDMSSKYFLGILGGENRITRGVGSSNPSLGAIAGTLLSQRLELGMFYRRIWTHTRSNGTKQEQLGFEAQYLFQAVPGLGAGAEAGMLVNTQPTDQWLSFVYGPVVSYDFLLTSFWSIGARLDALAAEGATNNDSINLLGAIKYRWE